MITLCPVLLRTVIFMALLAANLKSEEVHEMGDDLRLHVLHALVAARPELANLVVHDAYYQNADLTKWMSMRLADGKGTVLWSVEGTIVGGDNELTDIQVYPVVQGIPMLRQVLPEDMPMVNRICDGIKSNGEMTIDSVVIKGWKLIRGISSIDLKEDSELRAMHRSFSYQPEYSLSVIMNNGSTLDVFIRSDDGMPRISLLVFDRVAP